MPQKRFEMSPPHLSASLIMRAISSADKANVISLLSSCHSIRKVESITGKVKLTVGRIYQELEINRIIKEAGHPYSFQLTRGGLPIKLPLTN